MRRPTHALGLQSGVFRYLPSPQLLDEEVTAAACGDMAQMSVTLVHSVYSSLLLADSSPHCKATSWPLLGKAVWQEKDSSAHWRSPSWRARASCSSGAGKRAKKCNLVCFSFLSLSREGVAALHHRRCKVGQFCGSDWVGGREESVLDAQGMSANSARRNQGGRTVCWQGEWKGSHSTGGLGRRASLPTPYKLRAKSSREDLTKGRPSPTPQSSLFPPRCPPFNVK